MGRSAAGTGPRVVAAGILCGLWLAVPALATDTRLDMPRGGARDAVEAGSLALAAARDAKSSAQDVIAAARADYANILALLYDRGFFGPAIHILLDGREASNLPPFDQPSSVGTLVIEVDPGPQFTFGVAEIGPLARRTRLPDGFAPGRTAGTGVIREAARAGIDGWRDVGNAKAEVTGQDITASHPAARLDARLTIDPGPRVRFGRLIVSGNDRVRTDRIVAIGGLKTGKVFSPRELEAVARRLRQTGAFSSVALEEAEYPTADGRLDITAAVVEAKPRRFGAGIELGSSEGLTLSGYWMHRNLFRGAERLRFDLEVGGIGGESGGMDYSLAAAFARPGTFAPANTLNVLAEVAHNDEPDYVEDTFGTEVNILRQISERTNYSFGLGYRFSQFQDDFGDRSFSLINLPLTAEHDRRDAPLNARAGWYARAALTPFYDIADSRTGGQLTTDARYYRSFGARKGVTVAGRLLLGSIFGTGIEDTPPDYLFYSGGGGTVRGQPYQSLHVTVDGNDIGGRNLIVSSAEIRVQAGQSFQVVGFADWGFVGEGSLPGSDGASQAGAGLGLRYDTPIGPIRLDVGAPVSGDTGKGVQIYIGIGQAF